MAAPVFESAAVIGFGEAGPVFARGLLESGVPLVRAYDQLIENPGSAATLRHRCETAGVECAGSPGEAVRGAALVLSTVTADQAVTAALAAASHLAPGQVYLDLNSCSPRAKRACAEAVHAAGAVFVEAVAMDTVPNHGHRVPLLLAGPHAHEVLPRLLAHGFVAEVAGTEWGQASSIKLLRSILIKGLEALFAESMAAAGRLGIEQRVVDSLYITYPGLDWYRLAGYHLSRIAIHGKRRASEMEESAETVEDLGITPIMARAIASRHAWAAQAGLRAAYPDVKEPTIAHFLEALRASGVYPPTEGGP
jgi:3-hydroxyisobutyrate dehydrogenase-like beta-hydroxyacid dehydrogenase